MAVPSLRLIRYEKRGAYYCFRKKYVGVRVVFFRGDGGIILFGKELCTPLGKQLAPIDFVPLFRNLPLIDNIARIYQMLYIRGCNLFGK